MNTIDKIRAEIERRKKENMYVDLPMSIGRYYEDRDLLSFLDTLEEPVSDDLDEELENYYGSIPDDEDKINAARHFAKWGAEHLRDASKMISGDLEKKTFDDYIKASPAERRKMNMAEILGEERLAKTKEQMDLEEAADKFAHSYDNGTCDGIAQDCFKAGAEWMKAKMMGGAVETIVTTNLANQPTIYLDQLEGFQYGNKVKIIIVKEDKK